ERVRGRLTMAVPGLSMSAGGVSLAADDDDFKALQALLREHEVEVVMAGDTHDLEHYVERYRAGGAERVMHHVVNGGGGAYLSSGTSLAWAAAPALPGWAVYPSAAPLPTELHLLP